MRSRLFSKEFPQGKLFTSQDEVDAAMIDGWVDAEWKVGQDIPVDRNGDILDNANSKRLSELGSTSEPMIAPGTKLCACGCGTPTMKTWAPGHFAKHQKAVREADGNSENGKPADNVDTE